MTYRITSGGLVGGDAFTGILARSAGKNVGTYAIGRGTLAVGGNYDLSFVGANLLITARPITVTADPQIKSFGEADPELTYRISSGSLVVGDLITGSLTRLPGEDVGTYPILLGSLSAGPNYAMSYVGADLTITIATSSLSGLVYVDFNNDGQVDFGEKGIAGVTVHLTGTDDRGNAVDQVLATDADGAYVFRFLRPGTYRIAETQPTGYNQGINTVGTEGGMVSGDEFALTLAADRAALNYNFGERPVANGSLHPGQTAGIGFWNNKNGQALIKSLNGGQTSIQLGNWLAATFPNMYGKDAASNDLTGKTNTQVAAFFQSRFVLKGSKVDAQVLATALSVYVTNATLDSTRAAEKYGFTMSEYGVGSTGLFNVGSYGVVFGVPNNTTVTVMDLLLAVNARSANGVLFKGDAIKRLIAEIVFGLINEVGGI